MTIATTLGRTGRLRAAINLGNPVLAQRSPDGQLGGVSVALARELARQANCELEIVTYDAAGKVVEACRSGAWDVAFLAIDPTRATEIAFTEPYVKIEGVFVVAQDAPWQSIEEIDQPGVRIAVGRGAAYDLHLTRELKHAELVRVATSAEALPYFVEHGLEAAANVRQPATAFASSRPGLRVIDKPFVQIRQAMALPATRRDALEDLQGFLAMAKSSGLVARELAASGHQDLAT